MVRHPRSDQGSRDLTVGALLYAPPVDGDTVVMDFNFAQNPPCAYDLFTMCPRPPPQNRLPVAIATGEKVY